MYGDRIICRTCGRISRTIEKIEDSRQNPNYHPTCPYCHGSLTTNIEEIVDYAKKRGWEFVLSSKKLEKKYGKERLWDVYIHKQQYPRNRKDLNSRKDNYIYGGKSHEH